MSDFTLGERIKNAWNAFSSRSPTNWQTVSYGYSYRPDRTRLSRGNERSIVTAIYNRIAIDVAAVDIKHVKLDDNLRYLEDVNSGLNNIFSLEANIDQSGREFVQDIVMSMFDEGCVALVPTWTDIQPKLSGAYDILEMRTAKVINWYPEHVKVQVYNDRTGRKEEITLPKKLVAIIENPLYAVMNEPNSTLQRLIRKLNLLDYVDEQNSSGKLDLIIQLPYTIKSELRKQQAEARRKQIEDQLVGSRYGIAYTDGTERITQLNRPVDNNLMSQIEYLTSMLYGQLGMTEEIFKGTADEAVMLNYYNRTIEPILSAITNALERKYLTKTARSQNQAIKFFRDPFKLVPVNQIAEIADKFTRNEIMTSNEIRQIVGMKPSEDPKADELRNSNIAQAAEEQTPIEEESEEMYPEEDYEPEDPMSIPVSDLY